jgi:hypothetical protein
LFGLWPDLRDELAALECRRCLLADARGQFTDAISLSHTASFSRSDATDGATSRIFAGHRGTRRSAYSSRHTCSFSDASTCAFANTSSNAHTQAYTCCIGDSCRGCTDTRGEFASHASLA